MYTWLKTGKYVKLHEIYNMHIDMLFFKNTIRVIEGMLLMVMCQYDKKIEKDGQVISLHVKCKISYIFIEQ